MTGRGDPWQATVIDTAKMFGWTVAHFRPVFDGKRKRWITGIAADGKGYPDLTLVRDRVVFAELKSGTGRLTNEQAWWLEKLRSAGVEAYEWRDTDYEGVVAVLRRRSQPTQEER